MFETIVWATDGSPTAEGADMTHRLLQIAHCPVRVVPSKARPEA